MASGPNFATSELLSAPVAINRSVDPGWRRRRLWWSRWRRMVRWEFWPVWAIYPPVVAYILWLGLKHRGLTKFTAVNPGLPAASGLVGMSKSVILTGLADAGEKVARWTLVDAGDHASRLAEVRQFMVQNGLSHPIVLKPDRGERGEGVTIARSAGQVEQALQEVSSPLVVQAYVPGVEFGVFYVRHPDEEAGEVFAVTEKRDVKVVGDGRCTLEELILRDDRAVTMAAIFLQKFAARLPEVPAAGCAVTLSELGTHCRGALFLDGAGLVTSRLQQAIDRVSRSYPGFHFGRYDVRADSVEAFQQGEFKVIELNGVTSEATHIYDPGHSVWFGWRTLCRQWGLAFSIGAANQRQGARVWRLRQLWRLWREHRQA